MKIWVIDLLHPSQRYLADKSYEGITEKAEYGELLNIVLNDIIGNVTCTKLGLGLVNDLQNLKTACDYPSDKKLVSFPILPQCNLIAFEKLPVCRKHVQESAPGKKNSPYLHVQLCTRKRYLQIQLD